MIISHKCIIDEKIFKNKTEFDNFLNKTPEYFIVEIKEDELKIVYIKGNCNVYKF